MTVDVFCKVSYIVTQLHKVPLGATGSASHRDPPATQPRTVYTYSPRRLVHRLYHARSCVLEQELMHIAASGILLDLQYSVSRPSKPCVLWARGYKLHNLTLLCGRECLSLMTMDFARTGSGSYRLWGQEGTGTYPWHVVSASDIHALL